MADLERRIYHVYRGVSNPFSGDGYKFKLEVPRGQVVETRLPDEYGHNWVRRVDTREMGNGWKVKVSEGWESDKKLDPSLRQASPFPFVHFTLSRLDRVVRNPDTDGFKPEKTYSRDLRGWRNGLHIKSLFGVGFPISFFGNDRDVVRAEYWLAWKARQLFRRG